MLGHLAGLGGLLVSVGGEFSVLTANAYNLWTLVGSSPLAQAIGTQGGTWTPDSLPGGVPAVVVGAGLLCLVGLAVAGGLLVRDDRLAILLGFAVAAFAFYALPTRVHERYLFPFFATGTLLVAGAASRALGYVAVGVANAINVHAVLASSLSMGFAGGRGPGGPGPGFGPAGGGPGASRGLGGEGAAGGGFGSASSIHLPLADLARSEPVVVAVALGQTLAFAALLAAWFAVALQPVVGARYSGRREQRAPRSRRTEHPA